MILIQRKRFAAVGMTTLAACAAMIFTGCGDKPAEKSKQSPSQPAPSHKATTQAPANKDTNKNGTAVQQTSAKEQNKPMATTEAKQPQQQTAQSDQSVDAFPDAPNQKPRDQREETSDMIYSLIRIRMESMIEKRKQLLASGKTPSDVEVRELEGSIMRARSLLTENGEVVEEVEPPIVLTAPKQ